MRIRILEIKDFYFKLTFSQSSYKGEKHVIRSLMFYKIFYIPLIYIFKQYFFLTMEYRNAIEYKLSNTSWHLILKKMFYYYI